MKAKKKGKTPRSAAPPFTPRLSTDDDTSNFEEVSPAEQNGGDNFQIPKAFNGAHLSFIGFTYANEFRCVFKSCICRGLLLPQPSFGLN